MITPRTLFRLSPRTVPTSPPPLPAQPPAEPYAAWLVAAVWAGMTVLLFGFVARYTTKFPVFDEYCHLEILLGDSSYWLRGLFWQHNEHRLPLPRLTYWLLMSATGFNFKSPCFFNAACLTLVTLALLTTVRAIRGHRDYADAFLPLVVMCPGQWENLLWGFQVQFVLSTTLILGFVALVVSPRYATSTWRVSLTGLIGVLLPLCGANGVAFNPALAAFLGWVGVRGLRQRSPETRRPARVALVGAALSAVLAPLYFVGLEKAAHHPWAGVGAALKGLAQMLALTFGPVGYLAEGPGADTWPVLGFAVLVLLVITLPLVLWRLRDPDRRVQVVGLSACAIGILCLAAGVAYGRAGLGLVLPVNRYVTLMMPLAVILYLIWSLLPGVRVSRFAGMLLLLIAAACVWPNTAEGRRTGLARAALLTQCEMDARNGMAVTAFADKHELLYPNNREQRRKHVREMRARRIGLFAQLADDPSTLR